MILFTDFNLTLESYYNLGYSFVMLIVLMIVVNLSLLIYKSITTAIVKFKRKKKQVEIKTNHEKAITEL